MQTDYLKQITLLYVEDEDYIRELMTQRLSQKVKQLFVAKDGQEGLELYTKHTPDLVLSDITMPKIDGISMSEEIKEKNKKASIILMSAHSDTNYLLNAIELGIRNYLLKPINKNKLFATLEENAKIILLKQELERKELQSLHQSRFALLGEMTSMLAHQWTQPLTTISLQLNKIQLDMEVEKYDLNDKNKREEFQLDLLNSFEKISSNIQNLSKLIDGFKKAYSPSDKLTAEDINGVLKTAVKEFKNNISSEEFMIIENYNSTKNVALYLNEFIQICLNLLNNAKEHFQEREIKKPYVVISTRDIKNKVIIEILDNAKGVEEGIISKIFDPYFSTKETRNGSGLGLYITKIIIEEHMGGEISVKNEEDGVKFSIVLNEVL